MNHKVDRIKLINLVLSHRFRRDRARQYAFDQAVASIGYRMPHIGFTADLIHYRNNEIGVADEELIITISGQVAIEAIEKLKRRLVEIKNEVKEGVEDKETRQRLFAEANDITIQIAEMTEKLEVLADGR